MKPYNQFTAIVLAVAMDTTTMVVSSPASAVSSHKADHAKDEAQKKHDEAKKKEKETQETLNRVPQEAINKLPPAAQPEAKDLVVAGKTALKGQVVDAVVPVSAPVAMGATVLSTVH